MKMCLVASETTYTNVHCIKAIPYLLSPLIKGSWPLFYETMHPMNLLVLYARYVYVYAGCVYIATCIFLNISR